MTSIKHASSGAEEVIEDARRVYRIYAEAIGRLATQVTAEFEKAVELVSNSNKHIVVTGVGKSGIIGRKIAATLASTGNPSFFIHPTEAMHGDLGMIVEGMVAIVISNSGRSDEVRQLLAPLKRLNTTIIALTADMESPVAHATQVILDISVDREACPLNLAPTTSALVTLAVGDALAVASMKKRDFRDIQFAQNHPGGELGRRTFVKVSDVMIVGNLPLVTSNSPLLDVILCMTEGKLGLAIVASPEGKLEGVITDGDFRRFIMQGGGLNGTFAANIMTVSPITTTADTLLSSAENSMRAARVQSLIVVDEQRRVLGLVSVFDAGHRA